jgi:hypothetical protein
MMENWGAMGTDSDQTSWFTWVSVILELSQDLKEQEMTCSRCVGRWSQKPHSPSLSPDSW